MYFNKYFNAQQLGILLELRPGVGFLASFVWGFIGDWTQRHLLCLISGLVISTVAIQWLVSTSSVLIFTFMALLNIVTIFGASGCLFDIVLLILGEKKDEDGGTKEYGATRLWGALGWGLGALLWYIIGTIW